MNTFEIEVELGKKTANTKFLIRKINKQNEEIEKHLEETNYVALMFISVNDMKCNLPATNGEFF